jgi:hypothetical protein
MLQERRILSKQKQIWKPAKKIALSIAKKCRVQVQTEEKNCWPFLQDQDACNREIIFQV